MQEWADNLLVTARKPQGPRDAGREDSRGSSRACSEAASPTLRVLLGGGGTLRMQRLSPKAAAGRPAAMMSRMPASEGGRRSGQATEAQRRNPALEYRFGACQGLGGGFTMQAAHAQPQHGALPALDPAACLEGCELGMTIS